MNKLLILILLIVITACGTSKKFTSEKETSAEINSNFDESRYEFFEQGVASFYSEEYHGRKTASGEIFNMNDLTAAHPTLPFGVKLLVRNIKNNKSVIVRVNDRMPDFKGRVIDLSLAAARKIDMISDGIVEVKIYRIK